MHFTGRECFFRHGIIEEVVLTEGAKFLADRAKAYWLLDEIALCQRYEENVAAQEFQLWTLAVNVDQTLMESQSSLASRSPRLDRYANNENPFCFFTTPRAYSTQGFTELGDKPFGGYWT